MTASISNPWGAEPLFAKSILYIQKMDESDPTGWEYGLFSALSLELLARAAIANVSPTLLANNSNQNGWRNISYALGRASTAKNFSPISISISEAFNILEELLPDFTKEMVGFCSRHTMDRNKELHTGEIVFNKSKTSNWLPRFYQSCEVLLNSMNKKLDDFVEDPRHAESLIKSLSDQAAKDVKLNIHAHQKVWENKTPEDIQASLQKAEVWAARQVGHRVKCPSCESISLLHGSPVGSVSTKLDDNVVLQRQAMLPSAFECIACGLKISGFSKLSSCGLGDKFTETTTSSASDFFKLYTEDDLEEACYGLYTEEELNEAKKIAVEELYEPDFNE